MTGPLLIAARVADALAGGKPVVALESTIITHGFPRPENLTMARNCEEILEGQGVVAATAAVLDSQPILGLDSEQLARLADATPARVRPRFGGSAAANQAARRFSGP